MRQSAGGALLRCSTRLSPTTPTLFALLSQPLHLALEYRSHNAEGVACVVLFCLTRPVLNLGFLGSQAHGGSGCTNMHFYGIFRICSLSDRAKIPTAFVISTIYKKKIANATILPPIANAFPRWSTSLPRKRIKALNQNSSHVARPPQGGGLAP